MHTVPSSKQEGKGKEKIATPSGRECKEMGTVRDTPDTLYPPLHQKNLRY